MLQFELLFYIRYECRELDEVFGKVLYYWNTTVSESCCVTCNGTVVPENTEIETEKMDDDCQTIKTSVCRTLPGLICVFSNFKQCH